MVNMKDLIKKEPYAFKKEETTVEGDGLFKSLRITSGAYNKAKSYGETLAEISKQPLEFYTFMIQPQQQERDLIRDIYLPAEQHVSEVHTRISGNAVNLAGKEISEKGFKVVGWCHCHPTFSTRPSHTDEENNYKILNQILPYNKKMILTKSQLIKGNLETMIDQKDKKHKKFRLLCDEPMFNSIEIEFTNGRFFGRRLRKLKAHDIRIKIPKIISYAYSLIISLQGQPFAEVITTQLMEFGTVKGEVKRQTLPVKIVETEDDVTYKKEDLAKELKERVSW